mgnify:CR=1 FL=1
MAVRGLDFAAAIKFVFRAAPRTPGGTGVHEKYVTMVTPAPPDRAVGVLEHRMVGKGVLAPKNAMLTLQLYKLTQDSLRHVLEQALEAVEVRRMRAEAQLPMLAQVRSRLPIMVGQVLAVVGVVLVR